MRLVVNAAMNFIDPAITAPIVKIGGYGEDSIRNFDYRPHEVAIVDGRYLQPKPSLDREGFELLTFPTVLRAFNDEAFIRRVYYPRVERLIEDRTGASKVAIFDHTIRTSEPKQKMRLPVLHAHNDYTRSSAPKRVLDLLGEEEGRRRLKNRFAQINVWRPVGTIVQTAPLALADARTIMRRNLVPTVLDYGDRKGEVYELSYDPAQRWVTFPNMTPDEVVLIKGFDSAGDDRAKLSPHTAFIDPASPKDAPPRKSIEVRAFAFFDV